MKKMLTFSALILLLAGCREAARVPLTVSESNALLLENLEIAEEKLEQSKEAYEDALTSLEQKKEEAYSAGLYDGCISLYLMMEEEEIVLLEEVDVERLDEDIKAICFEALSMSQNFWQNLLENGSYYGLPASE